MFESQYQCSISEVTVPVSHILLNGKTAEIIIQSLDSRSPLKQGDSSVFIRETLNYPCKLIAETVN